MRVLLADDQPEVRSALRLLLEQEQGLSVAGEASEVEGLLNQTSATGPDLILLDWELFAIQPPSRLIAALRVLCPQVQVIILSGRPEARAAALLAGADAFVSKGDPPDGLLAALRAIALRGVSTAIQNGGTTFGAGFAEGALRYWPADSTQEAAGDGQG